MLTNYHTHTVFCDGKDTPEEMVLRAIELGMGEIGFSSHSYTFFDTGYCMSKEDTETYKSTVRELGDRYSDRIKVLLGVEQDYFSLESTDDYEYVIGSVHYVLKNGIYIPVDESKEIQIKAVEEHYGGDFYAFIEDYYKLVGDVSKKTGCDIIGHFDLITKFNEKGDLFDTTSKRYVDAVRGALGSLCDSSAVFEINTGAMSRGYRTQPYPSKEIIDFLKERGKKLIFSSDCHAKENLLHGYDAYKVLI